jgi:hypothetical protein
MQIAALTGSVGRLPGAARSDAEQTAAPAADVALREPYLSPVIRFDKQARVLVFQFRDSETGDVTRQFPSEKVVKLYRDNAPKDVPAVTAAEPRARAPEASTGADESTGESGAAAPAQAEGGGAAGSDRVRVTA